MRILKLYGNNVNNVIATAIPNKNHKLYFNIMLGTRGKPYKFYTIYLASKHFKAKKVKEELELKGNGYLIQPVKDKGQVIKDKHGNTCYCIYKSELNTYEKDIVLIWEVPNRYYTNISYNISGDAMVLAEACYGKYRFGVNYMSPIPVLEIFGDCELTWTGIDRQNNKVGQVIKYNYAIEQWDIKPIKE